MLVIKVKRSVTKNKWQFEQVLSFFGTYISISQWTINVLHNFFVLPPPPNHIYRLQKNSAQWLLTVDTIYIPQTTQYKPTPRTGISQTAGDILSILTDLPH